MAIKYKIVNGLLKPIEDDNQAASTPASTLADPQKALTCSYNFEDANTAAQAAGTKLADSTIEAIETVQGDAYVNKFGNPQVDGAYLMDLMNQIFTKIQAPIGLANKLIVLKDYSIHIKIDDSGSMGGNRWAQARIRLLEMMDLLQVVPTGPVTLSFLDRREFITIQRYGKNLSNFINWQLPGLTPNLDVLPMAVLQYTETSCQCCKPQIVPLRILSLPMVCQQSMTLNKKFK